MSNTKKKKRSKQSRERHNDDDDDVDDIALMKSILSICPIDREGSYVYGIHDIFSFLFVFGFSNLCQRQNSRSKKNITQIRNT